MISYRFVSSVSDSRSIEFQLKELVILSSPVCIGFSITPKYLCIRLPTRKTTELSLPSIPYAKNHCPADPDRSSRKCRFLRPPKRPQRRRYSRLRRYQLG